MEENLRQSTAAHIIKIAIVGPESTGKTTLARMLAAHFNTVWTPEFARDFLQKKWDESRQICAPEDQLVIAAGQTGLENDSLAKANKILFSDTSVLQTKVYSDIYFNDCEPAIAKAAKKHKYDLFLLTATDVPWEKDDLRDRPNDRELIFEGFRKTLDEFAKPYLVVTGDSAQRLEKAIDIIAELELAKANGFSSQEFVSIYARGIRMETILSQIAVFRTGISKSTLDRPAIPGDGIIVLADADFERYAKLFEKRRPKLVLEKFIPASGAASRMFKFLSEFLAEYDLETESINAYINRKKAAELTVFLAGLEKFPFFDHVRRFLVKQFPDFESWDRSQKIYHFAKVMLSSDYFGYCDLPKGVLPFHKYKSHIATPVEEHLNETVYYATGKDKVTNLHFTVSDSHRQYFESIIAKVKPKIEKQTGNKINVTFSFQDKSTDTIAVDMQNQPLRDKGELVFRPGGHGALIKNLGKLDADLIFIKNIDNVIQDHVHEIALYKNALGGILVEVQDGIFECLAKLGSGAVSNEELREIASFVTQRLNIAVAADFEKFTTESQVQYLIEILNRPLRVCGMVKNEGEPGGGPFWVRDKSGRVSLQIVESSQIDLANNAQAAILSRSTHFNPVDIVCSIKNYKREKFDLSQFIDRDAGFIVEKNKNGMPLKGYELPGLWNGAMSNWITLFVEVPLITFNPVKTVNDLLKAAHQP